MIRLALGGFDDVRNLTFDLSNRRLEVLHDSDVGPITAKLQSLGLGASLQETVAADPESIMAVLVRVTSVVKSVMVISRKQRAAQE